VICDKRPEQLKMDFALWMRGAVLEQAVRECVISLKCESALSATI
jgi:hypothetical protein